MSAAPQPIDLAAKLAHLEGDFVWHAHADTGEAFLVVEPRGVVNTGDAGGDLTQSGAPRI